jgi:hypothetical protein
MTCGLVNCGRQQFGGIGGNGHALQHYEETGHMVGVKLGTITPEGGGGQLFSFRLLPRKRKRLMALGETRYLLLRLQ